MSVAEDLIQRQYPSTGKTWILKETFTAVDGSPIEDSDKSALIKKLDGKFYKDVNFTLNLKDHCNAVGDGVANDGAALNSALSDSFKNSVNDANVGGRKNVTIKIPAGVYKITDTLITTGLSGSRFVLEGENANNTYIVFNTGSEKFLFNNNQLFGYTTFKNITFLCEGEGKFMNFVGGGSGNAQSLSFIHCIFKDWKGIIHSSGNTMSSEVTFIDCKIRGEKTGQVLFRCANPQGMNWRFYATDIESFNGTMIEAAAGGGFINFYQGSIVAVNGGKVIHTPATADDNQFGPDNSPFATFYGVRFEIKGSSKLIHWEDTHTNLTVIFNDCGLGAFNLTSGHLIHARGSGHIVFNNCDNFAPFRNVHNPSGHEFLDAYGPLRVTFMGKGPTPEDVVANGSCASLDASVNGSYPVYNWINVNGLTKQIKPYQKNNYSGIYQKSMSTKIIVAKQSNRTIISTPTGVDTDFEIDVPVEEWAWNGRFTIFPAWSGGYGSVSGTYKVFGDAAKTVTLATGTLNSTTGFDAPLNGGNFFVLTGKIIFQLNITTEWATTFGFSWLFKYEN